MTAKADEPRTMIKVPVSLRTEIKRRAKARDVSMMDYLAGLVYPETMEG
jgi:hypothetical protein